LHYHPPAALALRAAVSAGGEEGGRGQGVALHWVRGRAAEDGPLLRFCCRPRCRVVCACRVSPKQKAEVVPGPRSPTTGGSGEKDVRATRTPARVLVSMFAPRARKGL